MNRIDSDYNFVVVVLWNISGQNGCTHDNLFVCSQTAKGASTNQNA